MQSLLSLASLNDGIRAAMFKRLSSVELARVRRCSRLLQSLVDSRNAIFAIMRNRGLLSRAQAPMRGGETALDFFNFAERLRSSDRIRVPGVLIGFGSTLDGQLGISDRRDSVYPRLVPNAVRIVQIACGARHSAAVVVDGTLLTFGCGFDGQLGQGETLGCRTPEPVRDLEGTPIYHVACGAVHTAVVTAKGLFTFGSGQFGRLGLGDARSRNRPALVPSLELESVTYVSCGSKHTCALT
jgi:alpha-tubulin suppressor-like RCC1 family protein